MLISVVTGTYNRLPLLQSMIASARACLPRGIDLEFIIVDGGSTDDTIAWCESQADITLIQHGALLGAIKAFGDGARAAQGKYVLLANDDITFHMGSILKAIIHLEENLTCGAVAFEDNRKVNDDPRFPEYHVLTMPAQRNGGLVYVAYAQVGLFRKWLGQLCGWWGDLDPNFPARTYAGDNRLSAKIWELGYSVDRVEGCRVDDTVIDDELREYNRNQRPDLDSNMYYDLYRDKFGNHTGAFMAPAPTVPQSDKRNLRILYLPIFESGCQVQYEQKRGLRDALAKVAWVYEFDYGNQPEGRLRDTFLSIIRDFAPDILFTQLHGANMITPDLLGEARGLRPTMLCVNWNGDTHRSNLIGNSMLSLLQKVDLQLVVNASVLEVYEEQNITAAYWQIAFEPVDESALPKPQKKHEIVLQGSGYNDNRKRVGSELRKTYGKQLGLYGDYWNDRIVEDPTFVPAGGDGRTLYDFAMARALYKQAKIALGTNEFPNDYGFVSNRIFECLAAGGAILLQQHVDGLDVMTGLKAGVHYIGWKDLDDLKAKIEYWLSKEQDNERKKIARSARAYVHKYHSFDYRVQQLFVGDNGKPAILSKTKKKLQKFIGLSYVGKHTSQFGVTGLAGRQYVVEPQQVLYVLPDDAEYITRMYNVFVRNDTTAPNDELAEGARAYGNG